MRLVALCFMLALTSDAWAFKLNPCLRVLVYEHGVLSQKPIRKRNRCELAPEKLRQAVHEHMTNFAANKYRGKIGVDPTISNGQRTDEQRLNYVRAAPWRVASSGPAHWTRALIYGTWWNDDPLMYLQGEGSDLIRGLVAFEKATRRGGADSYEGGVLGCPVEASAHLTRASHFGELQHLHFMTNLSESAGAAVRVQDTVERSLVWIRFAYDVATQVIKPDDALTSQQEQALSLPRIDLNLCVSNRANIKVHSLFSRSGLAMDYRHALIPDVALGSIFHVLQDSFSPAHTCRVVRASGGEASAVLVDVYNYSEQSDDEHSDLDAYPGWLAEYARSGAHTYANDPIAVGAWLLSAVDMKLPWAKVDAHLRATIFAKEPDEQRMSAGKDCIRLK